MTGFPPGLSAFPKTEIEKFVCPNFLRYEHKQIQQEMLPFHNPIEDVHGY